MLDKSVDLMEQEETVIVSKTIADEPFSAKKPLKGWG
jgi:hypothetical protein